MLEIVKPGLETSIQDFPGRVGYWNQGFPPSGPMDMWSFRLANLVVGNDEGAPGLEAQFMGPTIRFQRGGVIAVTGANMRPILDGQPIPMWESVSVEAGQTLVMGPAVAGARAAIWRWRAESTRRSGWARRRPSTRPGLAGSTATR